MSPSFPVIFKKHFHFFWKKYGILKIIFFYAHYIPFVFNCQWKFLLFQNLRQVFNKLGKKWKLFSFFSQKNKNPTPLFYNVVCFFCFWKYDFDFSRSFWKYFSFSNGDLFEFFKTNRNTVCQIREFRGKNLTIIYINVILYFEYTFYLCGVFHFQGRLPLFI